MKVTDPNIIKYKRKYDVLKNSFNSLKIILYPNLNENRKTFLNFKVRETQIYKLTIL